MKTWKELSSILLLLALMAHQVVYGASGPKYVDFEEMIEEADFIVIGTLSEVGVPDMMLRTIEVEEYLKDPRNDSQITLRVTSEDTAGGEFSNAYASPLQSTGKVLVFVVFHEGFNRLLDGTYGVYQVTKKTSSDPDNWRARKTWLTSRDESTINYVHYYYDVVKPDNATQPIMNLLVNETKGTTVHIMPNRNVVGSLLFVIIAVLAVIGSVNRLRRMG
ncbi:hypothetical protein ES703_12998 [subsurface metagenome]